MKTTRKPEKQPPPGCVCDPAGWIEFNAICDSFSGDDICDRCLHDRACHDNARALREVKA